MQKTCYLRGYLSGQAIIKALQIVKFVIIFILFSCFRAFALDNGPAAVVNYTPSVASLLPVTGLILDSEGKPIQGVSILEKGTSNGTTSSEDGSFSLNVSGQDAVLVISAIGYNTIEVTATGNTPLNIVLSSFQTNLEDVVVVGYGTQRRTNITGAVSSVTSKVLDNRPVTAVSTGLQGTVPGLTTTGAKGQPGATHSEVRIRGIGTTNNSNALILIDGIPGDMNWINPEDIASVSVLKDAAAAAIYGSRAANGVILITTKNGAFNQKPTITYSGYYGIQKPINLPKVLGSVEYMQMLNEAQQNVGLPKTYTDEQIETARNGSNPDYFANTNWSDALIKSSAPQSNHNISISGGGKDINYYLSYGRLNQKGLLVGDQYNFDKNNARLKVNALRLLDIIDIEANIGYLDRMVNQAAAELEAGAGPIYTALTASPLTPVRFKNGTWGYGGGSSNPVTMATDGGFNKFTSNELTGNVAGILHILRNLTFRSQYGIQINNQKRKTFSRTQTYYRPESGAVWYTAGSPNSLRDIDFVSKLQNFTNQFDYNVKLDRHTFKLLAGYQQETFIYESFSASRTNIISDDVPVINMGSANQTNSGDAYQYALQSLFGRLNYEFDNRYLLEFNLRYDGSSRYKTGNKWGLYPSVSAGWRFTNELFLKDATDKWLSDGKLRASYGLLGNQYGADGPAFSEWYPYLRIINSVSTMPIGNILTTGMAQTILSNPDLQWEKTEMVDVGLDLAFFKNRLTFTGDWFNKKTLDIQLKQELPDVLGLTVPDQNVGNMSNKGIELSLGWRDNIEDFRYGITAIYFDIKNKVTYLGTSAPVQMDRIRWVGYPLDAFYGYRTDGLAQEEDFTKDANGKYQPKFPIFSADAGKVAPGDIIYRDLNGDGVITADKDREVLGNAFPRHNYSFRLEAGYKNFDLNVFLQGVGKASGYISGIGIHALDRDAAFPQEIHRDHWTPDNTDAWYPRFTFKETRNSGRLSDYWMQDASYLRLKNIMLGYTLPQQWLSKLRVDQFKIYLSADNLLTKTNFYYAYDPEVATTSGGFYPQIKTFTVGVNIRFK